MGYTAVAEAEEVEPRAPTLQRSVALDPPGPHPMEVAGLTLLVTGATSIGAGIALFLTLSDFSQSYVPSERSIVYGGVFAGIGLAAIIAGAAFRSSGRRAREAAQHLSLLPVVSVASRGGGLGVTGTF